MGNTRMGLFGPKKIPALVCPLCHGEVVDASDQKVQHLSQHLLKVVDINDRDAFTFECPKCGVFEGSWNDARRTSMALFGHLMQHGISFDRRWISS